MTSEPPTDSGDERPDVPDDEHAGEREDEIDDVPLNVAGHEDRTPPGERGDGLGALASDGERTDAAAAEQDVDEQQGTVEAKQNGDAAGSSGGEPAPDPYPDDVDATDGDEEEVEPIELLVQLAKDGEIDPWDVDVVAVTEEFLAALEDGDLRQSGRALFYASVLVRMKSDVLLEDPEEDDPEQEEPWDAPMEAAPDDAPPAFDPVDSLEAEMERRLQRKHVRGTPETLDELVRELREAERGSWWKESREYDTSESPAGFDRGTQTLDYHANDDRRLEGEPTATEVTAGTHDEDIEAVIDRVREAVVEHYEAGRPEVLFREVEDAGGSRVQTFLAVLFLANRGEIRLQQDELFGDLWLQDPTADLAAEGAVA